MTVFSAVSDAPIDLVLSRLPNAIRHGDQWNARCPAHEDRTPSLSVRAGRDGRVVLHCHAGCAPEAVVDAIGLTMGDLFPASRASISPSSAGALARGNGQDRARPIVPSNDRPSLVKSYPYVDLHGRMQYEVCRMEPKGFRQRRPDGSGGWIWNLEGVERVLYRLPEVREAAALGHRVYITEGEKDADALIALGLTATTAPGGAGKWAPAFTGALTGAEVIVLPDNDTPGLQHATHVVAALTAAGIAARAVMLPDLAEKGDVSDWIAAGGTAAQLERLANATRTRWRLDELLADETLMRPPVPLIPRLAWRGRTTLLAAAEKSGKSTLLGFLAAAASLGGAFLDQPCAPSTVLIVSLEESISDLARRLRHFGALATRVHIIDRLISEGGAPARLAQLRQHALEIKADLVIIDTLAAYASSSIDDENDATQMHAVVQHLTGLAHEMAVSIMIAHHARKAGGYRGSSAIGGAVDVIAEMTVPDEDGDPARRHFRMLGRIPVHGFQARYSGRTYLLHDPAQSVIERVLAFIRARDGVTSKQVRDGIEGRDETILAAVNELHTRGYITDAGDPTTHSRSWLGVASAPASVVPITPILPAADPDSRPQREHRRRNDLRRFSD